MADEAATLQILLDIRARLDEMQQTREESRGLKDDLDHVGEAGNKLRELFAEGLGIGSGMELARRGLDAFKESVHEAVEFSARLAEQMKQAEVRTTLSAEGYQTLGFQLRKVGGDAGELIMGLQILRKVIGEAADPKSPAVKMLAELGLSFEQLQGKPVEEQLELVARGLTGVDDENRRALLSAQLFGRGSAALNSVLADLAAKGLGSLTEETRKAAGLLGEDMAHALDEAGIEAMGAKEKFEKAFAGMALSTSKLKAEIYGLLGDLASLSKTDWAVIGGGAGAIGIGAGAVAAGGLGGPEAWGFVAALAIAKSAAWVGVGTVIAAGLIAAWEIHQAGAAAVAARDQQTESEYREDAKRSAVAAQLAAARTPEDVARASNAAHIGALVYTHAAQDTTDPEEQRRLQTISEQYSSIVKKAREHGAEIIAANAALDEQAARAKAIADETALAVTDSDELAKKLKNLQEQQATAEFAAALANAPTGQDKLKVVDDQAAKAQALFETQTAAAELAKNDNAALAAAAQLRVTQLDLDKQRLEIQKQITDEAKKADDEDERYFAQGAARITKQNAAQTRAGLDATETAAQAAFDKIAAQRAAHQADPHLTTEERRHANIADLTAEIAAQQAEIDALNAQIENAPDVTDADLIKGRRDQAQKRMDGLSTSLAGAKQDPLTGVDKFGQKMRQLREDSDPTFELLDAGFNGLDTCITDALLKANSLGDAFRRVFQAIVQSVEQAIAKIIALRIVEAAASLFFGGGGSALVMGGGGQVAAAGGGSFVTRGPTHFTVGDNPGGVELVTVHPLSGVGRTTASGNVMRMAGGGTALIDSMRYAAPSLLAAGGGAAVTAGGGAPGAAAVSQPAPQNHHWYFDRAEWLRATREDMHAVAHEVWRQNAWQLRRA